MERKKVYFGSVENALKFIQKTDHINAGMKLVSDTKIIDAKSILGVFSLDLSEPILLEVRGDDKSRKEAWKMLHDYVRD